VEMTSKPRETKPEANFSKFVLSETEINALGFADAVVTSRGVLLTAVIFLDDADDFNKTPSFK